MRVLYVVHQFYPQFVSGTEQYVLALARAGRARGDDVRVFTVDPDFRNVDSPRETARYDYLGVPVVRYRFEKAAVRNHVLTDYHNPEVGPAFTGFLDEFRPEAVHVFHLRWIGIDRIAEIQERGIPWVQHLMDFWYLCPIFLLLRPDGQICDGPFDQGLSCFDCTHQGIAQWAREDWAREQNAPRYAKGEQPEHDEAGVAAGLAMMRRPQILAESLQRADLVLSPSSTVRDVLAAAGTSSERLELCGYGIDREVLHDVPPPPADRVVIGYVGTLAPHKGVDVLVDAFRELEQDDLRLRIHGRFGDFPEFDEELKKAAREDPRIEFAGVFERNELSSVLGGLHMLVVPSRWRENTPFVCLEGRAAGLPIIASDLPGMSEAVPEGRGRLFRTGDASACREALQAEITATRARGGRLEPDASIPSIVEQYEDFRRRYQALSAR